jgi:hypothetical protein
LTIDRDGSFGSEVSSGGSGQVRIWAHANDHEDEVGEMGAFTIWATCPNGKPTTGAGVGSLYPGRPGGTPHLDAMLYELPVDQCPELGVNGGKNFW